MFNTQNMQDTNLYWNNSCVLVRQMVY